MNDPVNAINTDPLASRGTRLGAALIDGLLGLLVTLPVMSYLNVFEVVQQQGGMPFGVTLKLGLYGAVMFFVLHGYLLNKSGQTIGKYILNLYIVTLSGQKPEFAPLILKRYLPLWLATLVPGIGNIYPTVDVLFIFRKDKRCIHDLIAGTKVIKRNSGK